MAKSNDSKFINLYELRVYIDTEKGVRSWFSKYLVTFTGKNYIPVRCLTPEQEAQGYTRSLSSRVKPDEIMVVQDSYLWYNGGTDKVGRYIYFLDDQFHQAAEAIQKEMDNSLLKMLDNVTKLYHSWQDRPAKERFATPTRNLRLT